jgi:hypothetical protein
MKRMLIAKINKSTNINKTNNHLSPQHTECKKDNDMTMEIQVLGQAQKYGGVNVVNMYR